MNGFSDRGLDEDAFGEKKGNIVQAFDAFRKSLIGVPITSEPIGLLGMRIFPKNLH